MATAWIAVPAVCLLWWAFTGAILWAVTRADGGGRGAHGRCLLAALPALVAGIAGAILSAGQGGAGAVWTGFLSALLIWGWIEMAFLTGIVTGPSRCPMPEALRGGARFRAAWRALAWHELLLASGLVLLWAMGAETAFWTYGVLWTARISAKLNIFFGVPRINVEFLPSPLQHLPSYFRQRSASAFFPASFCLLAMLTTWLILWAASGGGLIASLLATLAGLATLEHLFMVAPLPDARLWRWMLPRVGREG